MSYRYIGNKTRLLDKIIPAIQEVTEPGSKVVDLMCGTASVAEALRLHGFEVVASDIMTFAKHHAVVRILLNEAPTFTQTGAENYQGVQDILNNTTPKEGFFFREFSPEGQPLNGEKSRQYFTSKNAAKLDAMSKKILALYVNGKITDNENSLLRHDLVLAANRVANIAGTYGHFRSKWNSTSLRDIILRPAEIISGHSTNHTVLQGAAEDVSSQISADLCYIDPPYMKRQYAANYHVIETIARGDEPLAVGVSGLREWRDQYSNFCSKIKIRNSFRDIFNGMDCPQFLISYSEDGLLSKEELTELFSEFGKVTFSTISHARFKSNLGGKGGKLEEFLFHVKKY